MKKLKCSIDLKIIAIIAVSGLSCLLGNISDNVVDATIVEEFTASYKNSLSPWWIIMTYIPILVWSDRLWSQRWANNLGVAFIAVITFVMCVILYLRYVVIIDLSNESSTNGYFKFKLSIFQTIEKLFFEVLIVDQLFAFWITELLAESESRDKYIAICDIVTRVIQSLVVFCMRSDFGYNYCFELMTFVIVGYPLLFVATYVLYIKQRTKVSKID